MKKLVMLSLVLGVVFFAFTGLGYADLNNGLVAYYPFNGNADDESGNEHHGTAIGNATLTTDGFGNADSAYFLNGKGSYIELPLIFEEEKDPLTISSWVNYSSLTTISCIYGEFNDQTGYRNYFFVFPSNLIGSGKGCLVFDHYPPSGGGAWVDVDMDSEVGQWVHLVMVKNNSVVYFYKNGQSVGSAPHTETWYDNNQNPNKSRLGEADSPEANRATHGKIDDVRIYDRALSDEEIAALYAEGSGIEVPLDIKPGSCPNPLNIKSKGVLPVAVAGTEDLDVTQIDPASIRLAGVAPSRSNLEDVVTPFEPFEGKEDIYDCNIEGPDGYIDLTLKFSTQEVVAALGDVNDGDVVVLELTGDLYDGTPIKGEDVVAILKKGKK